MRRTLALVALFAAVALPASAHAHGEEPAIEALETGNVYMPHEPAIPSGVAVALRQTVDRAQAAGYPLKVAVIGSQHDLGEFGQLWGMAQPAANLVSRTVGKNRPIPLLLVMPTGYGTIKTGPNPKVALAGVKPPASGSGDKLGRSAIDATLALAKAAGHPLPRPKIEEADGGGTSPALIFGAPVLLLALAGGLIALRSRQTASAQS